MVYVFEGSRNSGKTFLSTEVSSISGIPRFQFDFSGGFDLLNLESKDNREAHCFSVGKELMLMQISRDVKELTDFIHDRGIVTVLAWGLLENRIKESDVDLHIKYLKEKNLFSGIRIVYIEGENPKKRVGGKDRWDYADSGSFEKDCFEFVLSKFKKENIPFFRFKNYFNHSSVTDLSFLIKLLKN